MSIVLIDNGTICWAYCMSIRPIGFILFVKHTNWGWGHLLGRLNKRDELSGGAGTGGAVSHIRMDLGSIPSRSCLAIFGTMYK